jgi:hypothetical protein
LKVLILERDKCNTGDDLIVYGITLACNLRITREYTPQITLGVAARWIGTAVTGTAGNMNAVLTGMEDECAATVVVHWQWQVLSRDR